MIKELLLGTTNPAKINHYQRFLKEFDIRILTPPEVGVTDSPPEQGDTLEANAAQKAEYYHKRTGLPTLADDAGFEIPALKNFPGVHSRRFAGHEMDDREIIEATLKRMENLNGPDRQARMRVVLALVIPGEGVKLASGSITGTVPRQPYGKLEPSFPYRSLLFVSSLNKWFYEVTETEEEQLGYRKAALNKLKKYFT